jgi:hypothetical protein
MNELAAIRKRYLSRERHRCDNPLALTEANADIGKLLAMVTDGPPLPPEAVLHDAASAMDVARACFVNDQREEGLAELKRATALLRSLVATP